MQTAMVSSHKQLETDSFLAPLPAPPGIAALPAKLPARSELCLHLPTLSLLQTPLTATEKSSQAPEGLLQAENNFRRKDVPHHSVPGLKLLQKSSRREKGGSFVEQQSSRAGSISEM